MPARSTVLAMVVAVAVALPTGSSAAADGGHPAAQSAMERAVHREGVPGALGEAKDGGGLWQGSAGVADRVTHRPPKPGDRFRIGSLTKPFIAVVLLQLEAEGRLDLDAPVRRRLPGALGSGLGRVSVRELLGHTSGLYDFTHDARFRRDYLTPRFLRHRYRTHRPSELLRTATAHRPSFRPGTAWGYSNTNYVLAGMVIERVTGHSYRQEVAHRIVRPLGLRDTSLPGTASRIPGPHGRSYSTLSDRRPVPRGSAAGKRTRRPVPVHDVTDLNPSLSGASGEMVSSAGDLVRFFRALLTGRLLPGRELAQMKRTVPAAGGERYGLGLTEQHLPCGTTVWGHEGIIHGSRSVAVSTADGTHAAAFHVNGDWMADTDKLVKAEFCG